MTPEEHLVVARCEEALSRWVDTVPGPDDQALFMEAMARVMARMAAEGGAKRGAFLAVMGRTFDRVRREMQREGTEGTEGTA